MAPLTLHDAQAQLDRRFPHGAAVVVRYSADLWIDSTYRYVCPRPLVRRLTDSAASVVVWAVDGPILNECRLAVPLNDFPGVERRYPSDGYPHRVITPNVTDVERARVEAERWVLTPADLFRSGSRL